MNARIDLNGKRFTRLLVIAPADGRHWWCRCDCGVEKKIRTDHLRDGRVKSCGCFSADQARKHGMWGTSTYQSWADMIRRTTNPDARTIKTYATVRVEDSRWLEFEHFFSDMGIKPAGFTLERIDGTKGYCKDNCKWADYTEQNLNRKNGKKQTHPVMQELMKKLGIR